jgi:hypothetical protein
MDLSSKQMALILNQFKRRHFAKFGKLPSGEIWIFQKAKAEEDLEGFVDFDFNVMADRGLCCLGRFTICPKNPEVESELILSI